MIKNPKIVQALLFLPLVALGLLASYKQMIRSSGTEFIFPISGFDPRDLLSGHFITYRIDYGTSQDLCGTIHTTSLPVYLCLAPQRSLAMSRQGCAEFISGHCENGRFDAGLEKYYIPESDAPLLDRVVRDRKGSIVVSVTGSGAAQVKDLLIDGITWKKAPIVTESHKNNP
jgi:uncharacterized membrane-anchored protein